MHIKTDSEAVFEDAEAYLKGGDRIIKRPIIPEQLLDENAEPAEEIVTVPDEAETLGDLSLVVGEGDLTVPADAVGTDDETNLHAPADLDVPDGAARLFELLQDDGAP